MDSLAATLDVLLSKVIQEKVKVRVDVVSACDGVQSSSVKDIGVGPCSRTHEHTVGDLGQLNLWVDAGKRVSEARF